MPKIYVDGTEDDWEFCYSNSAKETNCVHLFKDGAWINLLDEAGNIVEYHKVEDIPNLIKALAAAYKQSTGKNVGLTL